MPWYTRWRNVFRPESLNRELDDELAHHLAETVDALVERGMPEDEAWRTARARIGNYVGQKERIREMNVTAWLDTLRGDVTYGLRQLRAHLGFTSIALLSLALGIGANTAIFQLVDAIRLKTLPVRNPQELVALDFEDGSVRYGNWFGRSAVLSYPQWQELRKQHGAFAGLLAWSADRFNLSQGGAPHFAEALFVSGNLFSELGVPTILGRTFAAHDDAGGENAHCELGAVVSYPFWKRELSGDPGALGRTLSLNGHAVPVIGVTAPSFFGVEVGTQFDVAVPLCADAVMAGAGNRLSRRDSYWLSAMGRLKPGESVQSATAYLHTLSPEIMRVTVPPGYRADAVKGYLANRLRAAQAGTGVSAWREQMQHPLLLLLSITGLVLVIACTNLANLLLARATARAPEIAVRLAIGASRARLIRQLLVESLLLAIAGAVLGTFLAMALSGALVSYVTTSDNPLFLDLTTDWRMLGFTAGLAALTCLLFGLLPAIRGTYLSPVAAMRAGGRNMTAGRERFGWRRALIVTQVALSLVLLFGASLFIRSFHKLLTVETGFQAQGVVTVHVDFRTASYARERRLLVDRQLASRLRSIPRVSSVAQVSFRPVGGGSWNNIVAPDRQMAATGGKMTYFNFAGPDYFRTMGTSLLVGRDFNDRDTMASPKVAIVNRTFARELFGGANPVGHTFHRAADAGQPEPEYRIIGLVGDTKYTELREDFKPIVFLAAAQIDDPGEEATFVLRAGGPAETVMKNVDQAMRDFNPSMEVDTRSLTAQLEESLWRERLMATLSGGFGILAGLLAAIGLYGVIAYMVARRQNEIGIRIALGAERGRVIRLVLKEGVVLLSIGVAVGIGMALLAGRAAATLLFGLQPNDGASLVIAAVLLAGIALIASYVPARRAAALEPMKALRNE